jgi:hypothetical protein
MNKIEVDNNNPLNIQSIEDIDENTVRVVVKTVNDRVVAYDIGKRPVLSNLINPPPPPPPNPEAPRGRIIQEGIGIGKPRPPKNVRIREGSDKERPAGEKKKPYWFYRFLIKIGAIH